MNMSGTQVQVLLDLFFSFLTDSHKECSIKSKLCTVVVAVFNYPMEAHICTLRVVRPTCFDLISFADNYGEKWNFKNDFSTKEVQIQQNQI